jgi:mRNA interferase MazF
MERGEIWWASLPEPQGAEPGGRRPVTIIQANAFNRSALKTIIVVTMTSNLDRAAAPGNVLVTAKQSGLRRDSVVNVSQIFAVDKEVLTERVGNMPARLMKSVDDGLRRVLSL